MEVRGCVSAQTLSLCPQPLVCAPTSLPCLNPAGWTRLRFTSASHTTTCWVAPRARPGSASWRHSTLTTLSVTHLVLAHSSSAVHAVLLRAAGSAWPHVPGSWGVVCMRHGVQAAEFAPARLKCVQLPATCAGAQQSGHDVPRAPGHPGQARGGGQAAAAVPAAAAHRQQSSRARQQQLAAVACRPAAALGGGCLLLPLLDTQHVLPHSVLVSSSGAECAEACLACCLAADMFLLDLSPCCHSCLCPHADWLRDHPRTRQRRPAGSHCLHRELHTGKDAVRAVLHREPGVPAAVASKASGWRFSDQPAAGAMLSSFVELYTAGSETLCIGERGTDRERQVGRQSWGATWVTHALYGAACLCLRGAASSARHSAHPRRARGLGSFVLGPCPAWGGWPALPLPRGVLWGVQERDPNLPTQPCTRLSVTFFTTRTT